MTAMLALFVFAPCFVQSDTLHPLLGRDPVMMRAAYKQGTEAARKKMSAKSFERKWAKDLGKVRQAEGAHWTAPYAVFVPPVAFAQLVGQEDAREYRDDQNFESWLKAVSAVPETDPARRIMFRAYIFAWPGVNDYDGSIIRAANQGDVRDIKFVLLVDGETPLHPAVQPDPLGETTFDGTVSIPEQHVIAGSSQTNGTATATGPGGTVVATGRSTTNSTVTYTDWTVQGFSAFLAVYNLQFPMFDKNGKPYVTSKTKKLVLKVIRNNGEHTAVFNLSDYRLPEAGKSE